MFGSAPAWGMPKMSFLPHSVATEQMRTAGYDDATVDMFVKALSAETDADIQTAFEFLDINKSSMGKLPWDKFSEVAELLRPAAEDMDDSQFEAICHEADLDQIGVVEYPQFAAFIRAVASSEEPATAVHREAGREWMHGRMSREKALLGLAHMLWHRCYLAVAQRVLSRWSYVMRRIRTAMTRVDNILVQRSVAHSMAALKASAFDRLHQALKQEQMALKQEKMERGNDNSSGNTAILELRHGISKRGLHVLQRVFTRQNAEATWHSAIRWARNWRDWKLTVKGFKQARLTLYAWANNEKWFYTRSWISNWRLWKQWSTAVRMVLHALKNGEWLRLSCIITLWKHFCAEDSKEESEKEVRDRGAQLRAARWRHKRFGMKGIRTAVSRFIWQATINLVHRWREHSNTAKCLDDHTVVMTKKTELEVNLVVFTKNGEIDALQQQIVSVREEHANKIHELEISTQLTGDMARRGFESQLDAERQNTAAVTQEFENQLEAERQKTAAEKQKLGNAKKLAADTKQATDLGQDMSRKKSEAEMQALRDKHAAELQVMTTEHNSKVKQYENDLRLLKVTCDEEMRITQTQKSDAEKQMKRNHSDSEKQMKKQHDNDMRVAKETHSKEMDIMMNKAKSESEALQQEIEALKHDLDESKAENAAAQRRHRQELVRLEEEHAKESAMFLRNTTSTTELEGKLVAANDEALTWQEEIAALQSSLVEAKAEHAAAQRRTKQDMLRLEEEHAKETAMFLRNATPL